MGLLKRGLYVRLMDSHGRLIDQHEYDYDLRRGGKYRVATAIDVLGQSCRLNVEIDIRVREPWRQRLARFLTS